MNQITFEEWTKRAKQNEAIVSPIADSFSKRRSVGMKHPVHDFLFTYYNFSTSKLKQWVPSIEEELIVTDNFREDYFWLESNWFEQKGNLLQLNRERIPESSFKAAKFISTLCDNISNKPARFNCFGLHEWAMVYKSSPEAIRHQGHKLRLTADELAAFVESQKICCSHYDAYRFFTEEARPLNTLNPAVDTRLTMEQAGCLHANMDLYKWATRLWPWIGSDFIAKTFFLALKGRELDMRASPYDLEEDGYSPICIETENGKIEYKNKQQELTLASIPLRDTLSAFCKRLITIYSEEILENESHGNEKSGTCQEF